MMDPGPARLRTPPPPVSEAEQVERTILWLKACEDIRAMRADLDRKSTDMSVANLDYFMGTLIIGNNLGHDWVEKHIDNTGNPTAAATYLRAHPVSWMDKHEHYVRVMELARRIFELGQEPFAERLIDNLRRRDLEGAAFEADVVRMLIAGPFVVDLREEFGTRGDDYDIDLWLKDRVWSIEAKTRIDTGPYSDRALTKTLKRAREQLPADGIGTIFMKIPTPWLDDTSYQRGHEPVVHAFLRGTRRVHAVVLVWDDWIPKPNGRGWDWDRGFCIFRNEVTDPTIDLLLAFFDRAWAGGRDIGPRAPF